MVPGGVGAGLLMSDESSPLSSDPLDALGDGDGDGVGDGVGFGVDPGELDGPGVGILKLTVHANCCTTGHLTPFGPSPTANCDSFGASVEPGAVNSACPFAPIVGPCIAPVPIGPG